MRPLLVCLLLLLACSQHDPATYGAWKVGVDGCDTLRTQWATEELVALEDLGPDWVKVPIGGADVVFYCHDYADCTHAAGQYVHGTNFVDADPACANGEFAWKAVVGHELVHWATWHMAGTAEHVCRQDGELGCTNVYEVGTALMNPALYYGGGASGAAGFDEAFSGDVGGSDISYRDQKLYRAAWVARH